MPERGVKTNKALDARFETPREQGRTHFSSSSLLRRDVFVSVPGDGECDDGPGAATSLCALGSDCGDCGTA